MYLRIKIVMVFVLFLIVRFPLAALAAEINDLPDRIDGKDRFEVSSRISDRLGQTDTVILANYLAFADALSATPLAYKLNAPILLTHSGYLTETTANQIRALKTKRVIIVGGAGSVSENVVSDIHNLGISDVKRIPGKDRFEVSTNIASEVGIHDTAVFANGLVFSDALTIAPYAAVNAYPIILTKNNELPPEAVNLLHVNAIKKSVIAGGEGSVGQSIFSQLPGPERIGGKDRYEVAANIAKTFGQNRSKVFLATGMTFADALTGSVLAAKESAVILLTGRDRLPDPAAEVIKQKNVPITLLGGTGSIKDSVVNELTKMIPTSRPILYIVPHQDDEILSYGIDIRNELSHGRQVQLILLTDGDDSGARNILNGDVYCHIHATYHNPVKEGFKGGALSPAAFANARTDEYFRASRALGVPNDHIHTNFIPSGQYYGSAIRAVIEKYLKLYPNADVRSFSWFDGHSAHALIGKTVQGMQQDGVLQRYQAEYFTSIYTDRFYKIPIPMENFLSQLDNPNDLEHLKSAIGEYRRYDPKNGYYAVGYHSVTSQFDALWNNPYSKYHY